MRRLAPALLTAFAIAGCVSTTMEPAPTLARPATPGEAISVLGPEAVTGQSLADCIGAELALLRQDLRVIPRDELRAALFPWLEPSTAPTDARGSLDLLDRPVVRRRIEDLRLRFVVLVTSATDVRLTAGALPFVYIGTFWDRATAASATVIDLRYRASGAVSVHTKGLSFVPGLFGLMLPLLPPTETAACGEIARRVSDSLGTTKPARD